MIADVPLFVIVPSLGGAAFATVASILRRTRGPWALLSVTVVGVALVVTWLTRVYVLDAVFLAPAVPGLLGAAGVLEWRARRAARSPLWLHIVWGTAAFLLTAAVGLVVVLAGFKCTGCVG